MALAIDAVTESMETESHIGSDLLHELMMPKAEDEELGYPPCLLTHIGKFAPYSSKLKVEETGSSPSTASELRLVEETPTGSSLSDWRDMSPMKVRLPDSYSGTKEPISSVYPVRIDRVEKTRPSQDATREPLPSLAAWAQAEARAGRFTCLSTTPELTRPAPPAYPPPTWPCQFEAPPLPMPPLPPQSADRDYEPTLPPARLPGTGKNGHFMCKFVFNGFDANNHADFELVPRLIGRKGCNLRPISQSCRGKIRVTGWDGSHTGKIQTGRSAESPVEVTLSCHDQESLDEGIRQLNIHLEDLSQHFSRYCYKRGISPVPNLYHLLL